MGMKSKLNKFRNKHAKEKQKEKANEFKKRYIELVKEFNMKLIPTLKQVGPAPDKGIYGFAVEAVLTTSEVSDEVLKKMDADIKKQKEIMKNKKDKPSKNKHEKDAQKRSQKKKDKKGKNGSNKTS